MKNNPDSCNNKNMSDKIDGVVLKELISHQDQRGYFREVIRSTDDFFSAGFGQLSHSLVYHAVIKAWHAHKIQSQWTYVASGTLSVVLHDLREDSPTHGHTMEFLVGDNSNSYAYLFPPGVAHGYKCVNGSANVIYITSGQYDLDDEIRISWDDSKIDYDWMKTKII